jgi:hypothetical protein
MFLTKKNIYINEIHMVISEMEERGGPMENFPLR